VLISTGTNDNVNTAAQAALSCLPTPREQQAPRQAMPSCHATVGLAGSQRLLNQANLLILSPATTTFDAQHLHLHAPYDLKAIPRSYPHAHSAIKKAASHGAIPRPSGCAFHPRCPFANERLKKERPELLAAEGTRVTCHAVEEGRLPAEERGDAGR